MANTIKSCVLVFTVLLMPLSAKSQKTDSMKWMIGVWKIATPGGTVVETWQIANDSTLVGKSDFVKSKTETIPQETMELAYRDGSWYFISTVQNQNNGQPVRFKVIFAKGTEFISENPTHDFPQRIAYRRIKQNLFASIEGTKGSRFSKQNFDFVGE